MQDGAVKTVDRVAAILRVLAQATGPGLALADLASEAGLSKPTAHRLLGALADVGFAFQDLASRRYRLGTGAAALGRVAHRQDVAALAGPALARIADETGDTAFASVIEGPAAICVARAVGAFPIRTLTLDIGSRRPLGIGAGSLALLAGLPDDEAARATSLNAGWLRDFPGFAASDISVLVARTRRDGFSLNEGRIVDAMCAVGVSVHDADGRPLLALSLAAIRDRMARERLPDLVALLRREAARLEQGSHAR